MDVFKGKIEVAGMDMVKLDGGIGDIMLMLELRKKIIYFRDMIGFPHCDDSVPVAEVQLYIIESNCNRSLCCF